MHPSDFNRALRESNWFNNLRSHPMTPAPQTNHEGFPRHTGATIRARMADDLVPKFAAYFVGHDMDDEWRDFLRSIEGQEVTLRFTHGDAFEQVNNQYWLPDFSWTPILEVTP
jgi:hypothetical protein